MINVDGFTCFPMIINDIDNQADLSGELSKKMPMTTWDHFIFGGCY